MPSATPKYIQCCVFLWIETVLSPSTYIERQRNRRWTGGYGLTATHSSWTWLPPGLNQATVLGLVGKFVRKLESISLCGESNMSVSLGLQLSGCVRIVNELCVSLFFSHLFSSFATLWAHWMLPMVLVLHRFVFWNLLFGWPFQQWKQKYPTKPTKRSKVSCWVYKSLSLIRTRWLAFSPRHENILLMEEIQHQLIGSLSQYLRGLVHPGWCSSTNSMLNKTIRLKWIVAS